VPAHLNRAEPWEVCLGEAEGGAQREVWVAGGAQHITHRSGLTIETVKVA
jgi:hypothetical protein